jgi:ribosomal biogenesis protein LAS1
LRHGDCKVHQRNGGSFTDWYVHDLDTGAFTKADKLTALGPYARPISHIAASLKIPQSLISLRHRATHEDLPPLPLLKQAVHSAIEYINHYSFLPSLASSSSEPIPRSLRAENLVGRWKKLIKARSRGEVGASESEREEKTLIREFEGEDIVEIAEALSAVGGLIPLAKR